MKQVCAPRQNERRQKRERSAKKYHPHDRPILRHAAPGMSKQIAGQAQEPDEYSSSFLSTRSRMCGSISALRHKNWRTTVSAGKVPSATKIGVQLAFGLDSPPSMAAWEKPPLRVHVNARSRPGLS